MTNEAKVVYEVPFSGGVWRLFADGSHESFVSAKGGYLGYSTGRIAGCPGLEEFIAREAKWRELVEMLTTGPKTPAPPSFMELREAQREYRERVAALRVELGVE